MYSIELTSEKIAGMCSNVHRNHLFDVLRIDSQLIGERRKVRMRWIKDAFDTKLKKMKKNSSLL